jgi:DNA repair protein RecN (Recombination protein N)
MLKSLEIKNYALIQNFDIHFKNGLHIITGETGAGKSILLGALGLVLGKRADTKVLFNQNEKCFVEATFDITNLDVKDFLLENDLDAEEEIIIRREIAPSGKSRAFINDTPVTLDLIQDISSQLIDIHQQFDTVTFQKPKQQIEALDAMIDDQEIAKNYKSAYKIFKQNEKALQDLKDTMQNSNKEMDFLLFQLKELEDIKLIAGEQEELESSVNKMSNAEDIKKVFNQLNLVIDESDNSIIDKLTEINRELSHISKIDDGYQQIHDRIQAIIEELKDIANESTDIGDNTDYDKGLLEANQERLNNLNRLQKKHGVKNTNELISLRDEMKDKVGKYVNIESEIDEKEKTLEKEKNALLKIAKKISEARTKSTPQLETKVNNLLAQLAMPNAKFSISITNTENFNENGIDNISFLFSANKGGELLPIKDVASGGELARLTLCIKSILASKMQMPTMVFDEIDTGVSGEVASKMGDILKQLSDSHQLIVITHSPQIASKADNHYFVFKQDESERTISQIKLLNNDERIIEIAKMLSGASPGKAALENARELLNSGNA